MNRLGSTGEQVENKLILLYLINKLNEPIGSLQVVKLVLENKLMNYFLLQHSLNELCQGNFIRLSNNEGRAFYNITPSGRQTLEFFTSHIPAGIRSRIDAILVQAREKIRQETRITADYTPESENKYIVRCRVDEDSFTLIDLTLAVGSRSDAKTVCENWKQNSQQIYSELIESLVKKRDEG